MHGVGIASTSLSGHSREQLKRIRGRSRSPTRQWALVIASFPREGAIARQCRRCFIARNGSATMTELRAWSYAGRDHKHWQYWNIKRALKRLGAKQIGRASGHGRPAIYSR
jgi:hypothetical protein